MNMPKTIEPCRANEAAAEEGIKEPSELRTQGDALRNFARNLLAETEDSPQAVVEVLNQHFWELV